MSYQDDLERLMATMTDAQLAKAAHTLADVIKMALHEAKRFEETVEKLEMYANGELEES